MRSRVINTSINRDVWFLSLPIEEQRFFLQLLITDRVEMSGVFEYPDRDLLHDMPFLSPQRLSLLKKRFEADEKVFFFDGWVWIVNFSRHNYFNSPQQKMGIGKQISELKIRNSKVANYFEEKGADMSLDEYLAIKRRNKIKKEVKKKYPNLMGQQLNNKVDHILGISDSGKMDWASFEAPTKTSDYPDVKSVKYKDLKEVAKEFGVRPYILYWFFLKKISKLQASGRSKNDYKALARDLAPAVIGKELDFDTKIIAATMFAKLNNVMITRQQAESMILEGKI